MVDIVPCSPYCLRYTNLSHGANELPETTTTTAHRTDDDQARRARVERVVTAYETLMRYAAPAHTPELLEVGVTMSQAKVLHLVHAEPGIRMAVLAARLGISLSTVSGVVDRLVDQGLLTRRDDPADRRHVVIGLTDAGASILEHFRELGTAHLRALLARIDEPDMDVVERAVGILVNAAAAHAGATAASQRTTGGQSA